MRVARTVHQLLASTYTLAFVHVHVHATRKRVLTRVAAIVGDDDHLALTLDHATVLDDAVDLGDDRRILRLARFEQLDDARQTAGDVLGLRRLARDLRQHVAGFHALT